MTYSAKAWSSWPKDNRNFRGINYCSASIKTCFIASFLTCWPEYHQCSLCRAAWWLDETGLKRTMKQARDLLNMRPTDPTPWINELLCCVNCKYLCQCNGSWCKSQTSGKGLDMQIIILPMHDKEDLHLKTYDGVTGWSCAKSNGICPIWAFEVSIIIKKSSFNRKPNSKELIDEDLGPERTGKIILLQWFVHWLACWYWSSLRHPELHSMLLSNGFTSIFSCANTYAHCSVQCPEIWCCISKANWNVNHFDFILSIDLSLICFTGVHAPRFQIFQDVSWTLGHSVAMLSFLSLR